MYYLQITSVIFVLLFPLRHKAQNHAKPIGSNEYTHTHSPVNDNFGKALICRWNNGKTAAFAITIDDNNEKDIPFWKEMSSKYGLKFTWFLICSAEKKEYNVSDWNLFKELYKNGHEMSAHDDRNWYLKNDSIKQDSNLYYRKLLKTKLIISSQFNTPCLSYAYPYGEGNPVIARKLYLSARGVVGKLNKASDTNYYYINSISGKHIIKDKKSVEFYIQPLLNNSALLYDQNYFNGWGCTHFHDLTTKENYLKVDSFLFYLKQVEKQLWIAPYSNIIQYTKTYLASKLKSTRNRKGQLFLKILAPNLKKCEVYPLTLKVEIYHLECKYRVSQGKKQIPFTIVNQSGKSYLLINTLSLNEVITISSNK